MKEKLYNNRVFVIIGAALFQCALVGILTNSTGTLLAQIRAEYGFSMTRVSTFQILRSVSGALGGTLVTTLLFKLDGPKFLMGIILLEVLGFLFLVFGADTWLWYICPVMMGPSSTVSMIAVPYLLNYRIPEHAGSATGIAMACSGLGGVLSNPLAAFLIEQFGWKIAICLMCALTVILAAIGVFLIFHGVSHSITAVPSSAQAGKGGRKKRNPQIRRRFILCCVCLLSGNVCVAFVSFISIFAEQIGYSLIVGATMVSAVMVGNIVSKLVFGFLCDWLGTWKAMKTCLLCALLGTLGFSLFQGSLPLLYLSAFLFGFCYAIAAIAVSKCALAAYDPENSKYYSGLHTSINCAVGAIGSLGVGAMFDIINNFTPMLVAIALITLISFAATILLSREIACCQRSAEDSCG